MKTVALRKAAKRRANDKKPNKRLIKKATKDRKKAKTLAAKTMGIKTKSPWIHEETNHLFNERARPFKHGLDLKALAEDNRKYRASKKENK
tara:strand:+ start:293 stop:565 length:273 start_codon:yes stop_codon:yes gene_type:complete